MIVLGNQTFPIMILLQKLWFDNKIIRKMLHKVFNFDISGNNLWYSRVSNKRAARFILFSKFFKNQKFSKAHIFEFCSFFQCHLIEICWFWSLSSYFTIRFCLGRILTILGLWNFTNLVIFSNLHVYSILHVY